jgi:predicted kinase
MSELQLVPDGYRGILYIMRGVPGSGKSHLALRLAGDPSKVFSTDEFFERMEGGYAANWKMDRLFPAHKWNQRRVREAMQRGISPVVVDNTNIRIKEARPYVEMGVQYQYHMEIRESDSPWWAEISLLLQNKGLNSEKIKEWANKLATGFDHSGVIIKNVHGVPFDAIHRMLTALNPYTLQDVQDRIKLGPE